MSVPYYPGAQYTPNLGLSLVGQDEVLAENMVLIDAAVGGGGSSEVFVNGSPITNPDFNDITPAAPAGKVNVKWQFSGSNVSAYVDAPSAGSTVKVNGSTITNPNFNDTTPATAAGGLNVLWQVDGSGNVSAYVPGLAGGPFVQLNPSADQTITGGNLTISKANAASLTVQSTVTNKTAALTLLNSFTSASFSIYVHGGSNPGNSPLAFYDATFGNDVMQIGGAVAGLVAFLNGPAVTFGNGLTLAPNTLVAWTNVGVSDTGISRLGAASLALGNGTNGNHTGSLTLKSITLSAPTGFDFITFQKDDTTQSFSIYHYGGVATLAVFDATYKGGTDVQDWNGGVSYFTNGITIGRDSSNNFDSTGFINVTGGCVIGWNNGSLLTLDVGLSRLGPASLALGNGAAADFSGTIKLNTVTLGGSSSGTASISVPAAAGTPNTLLLPTATGTSGQFLKTDGGNPQQLSWDTITPSTAWSSLTGTLSNGQVIPWGDAGISRTAAGSLAIGNGINGDHSGLLSLTTLDLFGGLYDFFGSSGTARQVLMSIGSVLGVEWNNVNDFDIVFSDITTGNASINKHGFLPKLPNNSAVFLDGTGAFSAPSASVLWSSIGNAAGNLILANAGFTTTFNQTSAVNWKWANTTAATVSVSQSSPILALSGQYWATGAATGEDKWTIQDVIGTGLNGTSLLTITHTGSTGAYPTGMQIAHSGRTVFQINAGSGTISEIDFQEAGVTKSSMFWNPGATSFNMSVGAQNILNATTVVVGIPVTLNQGSASQTVFNASGLITKYNNVSTVSGGVPAELAVVDLTAQSAAIGATTLYAVPAAGAGMYRISWSADITTEASTSSILGGTNGFQVLATSPTDSVVKTFPRTVTSGVNTDATNTTATGMSGVIVVFAKLGTNIQYQFDYTSVGVTAMVYELHIKLEAM